MTTFAVTNSSDLLPAVNYLLSNLDTGTAGNVVLPGNVLTANTTTGVVSQSGNAVPFAYLYQYVNLRYSNNATGTDGFDTNSNNYSFFGVYNSTGPTPSANPTAYQFFQVSPPFDVATSRTLYYSAIGGRQIQWAAASSPPNSGFQVTAANVAIDLDVVTTATGTTGERGPLGMAYVITTADPGNATSSTLTSWFEASRSANVPPIGTGLAPPVVGDTAYFTYPTTGQSSTFSYNGSVWNSVVGQVVSGDTLVANTVPGSSLVANTITGDKINANTITANNIQTGTLTTDLFTANSISANILTANTFAANTISGQAIDSGSITTDKLAANVLIANTVVSTGAILGSFASQGFWLDGNTGTARFGNTVSVGNQLNVGINANIGASAIIGANVNIGNLAKIGNSLIVANNANIGNNLTVGANATVGANLVVGINANIGNSVRIGNNATVGNNIVIGNNAQIGGNLNVSGLITSGILGNSTVNTIQVTTSAISAGIGNTRTSNIVISSNNSQGVEAPLTGLATVSVPAANTAAYIWWDANTRTIYSGSGTIYLQYTLRRSIGGGPFTQLVQQLTGPFDPFTVRTQAGFSYFDSNLTSFGPGATYRYVVNVAWLAGDGTPTFVFINSDFNNIIVQTLKR
jgi:acetyltransferase-like isoleucine patch superfamily enzyme